MNQDYELNNTPRRTIRVKQFLGGVAIAVVTALNPSVAHAADLAPSSPAATTSPSIEATATTSPSLAVSPIPSKTAQPRPSASAEATPIPTPQPSKIVIGVDDSGLYPTGPKPTDLVPGVPLSPDTVHLTHAPAHHQVEPNELPYTGFPYTPAIVGAFAMIGAGIVTIRRNS